MHTPASMVNKVGWRWKSSSCSDMVGIVKRSWEAGSMNQTNRDHDSPAVARSDWTPNTRKRIPPESATCIHVNKLDLTKWCEWINLCKLGLYKFVQIEKSPTTVKSCSLLWGCSFNFQASLPWRKQEKKKIQTERNYNPPSAKMWTVGWFSNHLISGRHLQH